MNVPPPPPRSLVSSFPFVFSGFDSDDVDSSSYVLDGQCLSPLFRLTLYYASFLTTQDFLDTSFLAAYRPYYEFSNLSQVTFNYS